MTEEEYSYHRVGRDTYMIVRHFHPSQGRRNKVMLRGLTEKQAQEHCSDPRTREEGVYFDGYTKED
tara:strand:- start:364 stop:561 length:198 start_codon:yes stop_codon:yes gene_type:complete